MPRPQFMASVVSRQFSSHSRSSRSSQQPGTWTSRGITVTASTLTHSWLLYGAYGYTGRRNRQFKDPLKGGDKVGCGIWRGKQAASGRGRGRGDSTEVRSRDRSERGKVAPWEVGPEGCSDGR